MNEPTPDEIEQIKAHLARAVSCNHGTDSRYKPADREQCPAASGAG
jgi:hypothetical protein